MQETLWYLYEKDLTSTLTSNSVLIGVEGAALVETEILDQARRAVQVIAEDGTALPVQVAREVPFLGRTFDDKMLLRVEWPDASRQGWHFVGIAPSLIEGSIRGELSDGPGGTRGIRVTTKDRPTLSRVEMLPVDEANSRPHLMLTFSQPVRLAPGWALSRAVQVYDDDGRALMIRDLAERVRVDSPGTKTITDGAALRTWLLELESPPDSLRVAIRPGALLSSNGTDLHQRSDGSDLEIGITRTSQFVDRADTFIWRNKETQ